MSIYLFRPDGETWGIVRFDDWAACARLVPDDAGHPAIAELRILPSPGEDAEATLSKQLEGTAPPTPAPAGGLTARQLRRVPLGGLAPGLIRHLAAAHGLPGTQIIGPGRHTHLLGGKLSIDARSAARLRELSPFPVEAVATPRKQLGKGRGPSRPDSFYAHAAAAYISCLDAPRPAVEAAKALSGAWGGEVTPRYVRGLLSQARDRGLLTRPPRGRAGGELTEKGRQALEGK